MPQHNRNSLSSQASQAASESQRPPNPGVGLVTDRINSSDHAQDINNTAQPEPTLNDSAPPDGEQAAQTPDPSVEFAVTSHDSDAVEIATERDQNPSPINDPRSFGAGVGLTIANNLRPPESTGLETTDENPNQSWNPPLGYNDAMELDNYSADNFSNFDFEGSGLEANLFALDSAMNSYYEFPTSVFNTTSTTNVFDFAHTNGMCDASLEPQVTPEADTGPQNGSRKHPEIMAELPHWNICRCTPAQSATIPKDLEPEAFSPSQLFGMSGSWSDSIEKWRERTFKSDEHITQVDLTEETREWMLVILQSLLQLSPDFHVLKPSFRSSLSSSTSNVDGGQRPSNSFMLLPPNGSLRRYLEIYLTSFEPFLPSIPALSLNPNKLATSSNERGATVLLLLMVALGAMLDPAIKARHFSKVLFELCRHTILDTIAKDDGTSRQTLTLHCALLFVVGAAFSGKRLHMNIATCQRHMFLETVKYAHFFQQTPAMDFLLDGSIENLDVAWQRWIDRENASRLAYLWIIADHEISLFYDTSTRISTSELEVALPSSERLWLAPNAIEWKKILIVLAQQEGKSASDYLRTPRLGLDKLFVLLLSDQLDATGCDLQPLHLRLLLCPIQDLVTQLRQLLICLPRDISALSFTAADSLASSALRISEIRNLLRRWHNLCRQVQPGGVREEALMQSTWIVYHLISLNLLVSFRELESFSRGESSGPDIMTQFRREWIHEPEQTIFHCGQILRVLRGIDVKLRPIWWSASVYRVTIILWSLCIGRRNPGTMQDEPEAQRDLQTLVMVDSLVPDDPKLQHFLRTKKGNPCLDLGKDKCISVYGEPRLVHQACVGALEGGPRTSRFTEGIQAKLETMGKLWDRVNNIKAPSL
ncbi:uncharacterized protein A1O9_12728 [Exophiala aquamarina CBS 119918]|uniref:Transcription factor domain-containing protein n=1 Tax=Exophiala aquamarina CBS 119918 TaxID=1182545 RepID=A0A072P6J3_9EURO|nr:uncharacterized protein A1O9_12728 [Exophiala aquamarina CBS 119918]KEF51225.1 hypothetical protein A1O9_12728 [Exophiala aquamarina CBS 119918]